MRIAVDDKDFEQDDYIPPTEEYVPGAASKPSQGKQIPEESLPIPQEFKLGVDINPRKFITIVAMFFIMFMLPIGISNGLLDTDRFSSKEVYTSEVISQDGKVAGVSTVNASDNLQQNATSFVQRDIMGISMGMAFVIIGIGLVSVSTVLLLR